VLRLGVSMSSEEISSKPCFFTWHETRECPRVVKFSWIPELNAFGSCTIVKNYLGALGVVL